MMGKNRPITFPAASFAANEIQTAMQTRKLQKTPRMSASEKLIVHFPAAVEITDTAMPFEQAELMRIIYGSGSHKKPAGKILR